MSDLIAADLNPVPFSPYFTLTYSWFVSYDRKSLENPPIPLPPDVRQPKQKTEDFTVERLFGGMRKMSDDTQAQFLLMLMKHTDIDWSAACKEAAKARKIRPVSKVAERLSRIAHKHAFELEDGKKITGGLLLNKTLIATPSADRNASKEPKAPKIPRKRKSVGIDPGTPAEKKKRSTTETTTTQQNMEQTGNSQVLRYVPVQEAGNEFAAGNGGTIA